MHLRNAEECLYRNPTSGTYYAIIKVRGKQIKKSLETDNLPKARRKLKDYRISVTRIDHKAARNTLAHYAGLLIGGSKGGQVRKEQKRIVDLIIEKWPGGSDIPIATVKASDVRHFMQAAGDGMGWSNYNFILGLVKNSFIGALDDRSILEIPGERDRKRGKKDDSCWARTKITRPVRLTPSMDRFRAIVNSIRSQQFADTREETADFVESLKAALDWGRPSWSISGGNRWTSETTRFPFSASRPIHLSTSPSTRRQKH